MTPRGFVALAAVAALCAVAAVLVYTSSLQCSRAVPNGVALFSDLRSSAPNVAEVEVEQGGGKLSLVRQGDEWVLKQHGSFPADPGIVRSFMRSLADANLVEAKTRDKDRYALLGLEDPARAGAKSRLVQLKDKTGNVLAEVIVGNLRTDAFGPGKNGTYVRKPGEAQAWLVDGEIDTGVDLGHWVHQRLFDAAPKDVKQITVTVPGQEPLVIERAKSGTTHVLSNIPDGMKLKAATAPDDIVDAATTVDFEDARKLDAKATDSAGIVALELDNGLKVTFNIEKSGGAAWLSLSATGDGESKKAADALTAQTQGWEFRITDSKADALLKRRDDLLEKASPSTG
jgi:Domain of unknown function (DUF4340)